MRSRILFRRMKLYSFLRHHRPICNTLVHTSRGNRHINQHLRCVLLPSPNKLANENCRGENGIKALDDVDEVWSWLTSAGVCCPNLRDKNGKFTDKTFSKLVFSMFATLLDPFRGKSGRKTALFYYAGHGFANNCLAQKNFPWPLERARTMKIFEGEKSYLTKNRPAKGGDIVLHDYGRCDLKGLLELWTAGWRTPFKNKHLIVILDSCHSGVWVEDLKKLAMEERSLIENGCTVTVQSACGSGENTISKYFTPCFVNFNKPENKEILQKLKNEWKAKSDKEKNSYRHNNLPSPKVFTTMPSKGDDPILVFPVSENFHITLFPDPGFFKFCYQDLLTPKDIELKKLTPKEVSQFLEQHNFKILDFKLKTVASKPMALVLVKNKNIDRHVACVQIHFHDGTVSLDNVCEVSLTHHIKPDDLHLLGDVIMEDKFAEKFKVSIVDDKTKHLVSQCMDFAARKEPSWANVKNWNMTKSFVMQRVYGERTAWMKEYMKEMSEKNSSLS